MLVKHLVYQYKPKTSPYFNASVVALYLVQGNFVVCFISLPHKSKTAQNRKQVHKLKQYPKVFYKYFHNNVLA